MKDWRGIYWVIGLMTLLGCQEPMRDLDQGEETFSLVMPAHFPEMAIPAENQLTASRVALGKLLFYDKGLSRDSTVSCASCHLQAQGFADHNPIAVGIEQRIGRRNVPTLGNIGFSPYFFAEGGNPSLEAQVLGPLEDVDEMGFNAAKLQHRFDIGSAYDSLAQIAYGRKMDIYVLTRALASFERTLITGQSTYDKFYVTGDSSLLSEAVKRGMGLFFSERTHCGSCHPAPLFSDYSFQNVGLYEAYQDVGRRRLTQQSKDIGKFKVPTLRNVALTAPYMHDGSIMTLEDVVHHFNLGGVGHPNQSELVAPLGLTDREESDLVAFLKSLTDTVFVSDMAYR